MERDPKDFSLRIRHRKKEREKGGRERGREGKGRQRGGDKRKGKKTQASAVLEAVFSTRQVYAS